MEYVSGGNLLKLIREKRRRFQYFSEAELGTILLQVCEGLRHMHRKKLAHNDITPENILVERGADDLHNVYKIGDLGIAASPYWGREVLQYKQGFKEDIFFLGLTIYKAAGGGTLRAPGMQCYAIRRSQMLQEDAVMRPHAWEILAKFGELWKN